MNVHSDPATAGPSLGAAPGGIEELLAAGPPSHAEFAAFAEKRAFPLVEPGLATFAYFGDADHVTLVRWIHAGGDRTPFERMPGSDLWLLHLPVEDGGRFEYKIAVSRNGHEVLENDQLNPARAGDPFGQNSVARTFGYARPDWSRPQGAPAGRIEDLLVETTAFGETRNERIYLPNGYDSERPYPLVVIHDGDDFVTYADLAVVLDNLIAAKDIPAAVVALVQTGDRPGEYSGGRRHARYLVRDLLPAIDSRYAVSRRPEERVLLGASLGAVASLATAFRYPGVFGGLVLNSGSFILDQDKLERRPHPVFHRIARLVKALRRAPGLPSSRAFVSTGELEGLADENRALAIFLRERGVDVLFKSAWDGHHWHNWRDQLRDGLRWVLQPEQHNRE